MDTNKLRKTFALFTTGIAIAATTNKKGQHNALTINSLASLSLEPPLILFCIDNKSSSLKAFKNNKYFSLNILSEKQMELAKEFAQKSEEKKFDLEAHYFGKNGAPIFSNSLGFFECRRWKTIKAGDHHIIIGRIIDFDILNEDEPLIYQKGKYKF